MKQRKIYKKVVFRIIFLPVIFGLLLLGTTWLIIKTMFTQSALHSIMSNQLQNIFNRPVQIESAKFSFLGQIEIKGCKILEKEPGENFIITDSILVTYKLLPLLNKKIVIDKFLLISPKIQIMKVNEGWNISDIFYGYDRGQKSFEVNKIKKAKIKDGTINIKNLPNNASFLFENVNFTFDNFNFMPEKESFFSLSAFFKSNGDKKYFDGRIYSEGVMNLNKFNWDKSYIKNLVSRITILNKPITMNLEVKNIKSPHVSFVMDIPGLNSQDLSRFLKTSKQFVIPPSKWTGIVQTRDFAKIHLHDVSMETDGIKLKINGDIDFSTAKPSYNLTAHVQPFEISKFSQFKYTLPIANISGKSQLKLNLCSMEHGLNIPKFFFSSSNAGFSYKDISFSGINLTTLLSEPSINNYFKVTKGTLNFKKQKISNILIDTGISKSDLKLSCSGKWNNASFKISGSVKSHLSDKKIIDLMGHSKKLKIDDMQSLAQAFRKNDKQTASVLVSDKNSGKPGFLNLQINEKFSSFKGLFKFDSVEHDYFNFNDFYVSCLLKNYQGNIEKFNGSISVKTGSGIFYNVHEKSEKDRIYSIIATPVLMMHRMSRVGALKIGTTLKNVAFNSMGGEFSFKSGNISIKNFFIDGKDFSSYCTGNLDLINKTIGLKVYTIFSKYYSMGGLPESFTDSSGKPALAFYVHGNLNKPTVDMLSPKDNTKIINEIVRRGISMDLSKINQFISGGKK